jgi:fumarylacetoacetate (FAA) hydrolase
MKLVSYLTNGHDQLAFLVDGLLFDCDLLHPELPNSMSMFLQYWDDNFPLAQKVDASIKDGRISKDKGIALSDVSVLAPVPFPTSCRDGYAFRQHVATARRNRNLPMIDAFDEFPIFYFANHHTVQGSGDIVCMPDHFEKLDFELEAAIVVCKQGKNITADEADNYIGGIMIMNDMSARVLQMEEMQLNLGPAKGKDFSTAIGPCLVTLDELTAYETTPKDNHVGKAWHLQMTCKINGIEVSRGNLADMNWTFAEILERCAYGTNIYPGDVIGSGTVGTGCFLELNGTGKLNNPSYQEQWLQPNDVVEMTIEGIGTLVNTIQKDGSDFSILKKKKHVN